MVVPTANTENNQQSSDDVDFGIVVKQGPGSVPDLPPPAPGQQDQSIDSKINDVFQQLINEARQSQPQRKKIDVIKDLSIIEEPKIPRDRVKNPASLALLDKDLTIQNPVLECALAIVLDAYIEHERAKGVISSNGINGLKELLKHAREHNKLAAMQQYEVVASEFESTNNTEMLAILYVFSQLYFTNLSLY